MVCGITAAKLSLLCRKIFSYKGYKEKGFVPLWVIRHFMYNRALLHIGIKIQYVTDKKSPARRKQIIKTHFSKRQFPF